MKKIFDFKTIKMKVLFGFSLVILLVLVLALYTFFSVRNFTTTTEDIIDKQIPLLIADEKLAFNMAQRIALTRAYVLYGDEEYIASFNEYTEKSVASQEYLKEASNSEEVHALIDKSVAWRTIVVNDVFEAYARGEEEEAKAVMRDTIQPMAREIMAGFEETAMERESIIMEEGKETLAGGRSVLVLVTGLSILVLILGVTAALITSRVISKPIKTVMERMNLIAAGDLSQKPLETDSRDETGQLVKATNQMNENMNTLLNQINLVSGNVSSQSEELTQAANEVKAGSQQVAVTMQELASGSESQANSSTSLSAAMGSFSSKVEEANTNGEFIFESSNKVLGMTEEGSQLMNESVKQMAMIDRIVQEAVDKVKGLDSQSQEISKLVSVIKDIADQTNLLALNAAIEAARAGEHGRGFAVVADEVRKLAEQVSVSVTDITSIVSSIQSESSAVADSLQSGYKEVEKGTSQIKTTGETFSGINLAVKEMAANIEQITNNLGSITADSQEMGATIEEIAAVSEESAAGIEQTSASAQQTSSSMEEMAASSEELAKLAEDLNELVRQFKL